MMVSEKVTGDSSLIRAMSLLWRKHTYLDLSQTCSYWQLSGPCSSYRMNMGFHFSCTMMLEVPMNTALSSISCRLCFPMATLYCLPLLLTHRGESEAAMD